MLFRSERFQRRAAKIILRRPLFKHSDHDDLLNTLGWETLSSRRTYRQALLGRRLATRTVPRHLWDETFPCRQVPYPLRHTPHFQTPQSNTLLYQSSPLFLAATVFNGLPKSIQTAENFKQAAKIHLLSSLCSCSQHPARQQ